jgi:hypothetical protein
VIARAAAALTVALLRSFNFRWLISKMEAPLDARPGSEAA